MNLSVVPLLCHCEGPPKPLAKGEPEANSSSRKYDCFGVPSDGSLAKTKTMKPTVYLGADHAGFDMKNSIKDHLALLNYIVEDLGAEHFNENDDYPEYAAKVAKAVKAHPGSLGILSCGNAEGIAIAANKFIGIRAGIGYSVEAAKTMRTDDDANIMAIPGRLSIKDDALEVVETFLSTAFSKAERHRRRIAEIEN